jgi:hypothetical protein
MKIKHIATMAILTALVLLTACAELEKCQQVTTESSTTRSNARTVENSTADENTKYLLKQIIIKLNNGQTTSVANSRGQSFGIDGLVNLNGSQAPYMTLTQIKDLAEKSNVDVPLERYQELMKY